VANFENIRLSNCSTEIKDLRSSGTHEFQTPKNAVVENRSGVEIKEFGQNRNGLLGELLTGHHSILKDPTDYSQKEQKPTTEIPVVRS
jgi:hypothetical protein